MRRRPLLTRAFTLLAAVAVALAVSACFGSGVDEAGGPGTRVAGVLTFAITNRTQLTSSSGLRTSSDAPVNRSASR
jgi:hypothetical protein